MVNPTSPSSATLRISYLDSSLSLRVVVARSSLPAKKKISSTKDSSSSSPKLKVFSEEPFHTPTMMSAEAPGPSITPESLTRKKLRSWNCKRKLTILSRGSEEPQPGKWNFRTILPIFILILKEKRLQFYKKIMLSWLKLPHVMQ